MKQIKIFFISILAFTLFSCELNLPSELSLDAEKELNEADIDKLLTGLYARVLDPSDYVAYFNVMYPELLSDNFTPVNFQWFQVQDAFEHNVASDDILNNYNYSYFYGAITHASLILNNPAASDSQKARAKYCRALSYFRLIDLYDNVPYVDETYDNGPIAKSSRSVILGKMVEDLVYAKEFAPDFVVTKQDANTEPTKEAAAALLARVYRLQGNITEAGKVAEELIKGGKFSIANNPLDRQQEMIMNFATLPAKGTAEWGWIMSWDARTWNCVAAAPGLLALIKGDDTRKVLFDFENAPKTNNFVFSLKYQLDSDADLIISRIPEMYLISAEAGNVNRLTELQAKRKSSLTLAEERRLELAFEWVRWSDMKLSGETSYVLPIPKLAMDANPLLRD